MKIAIRIDDPPHENDVDTARSIARFAEKYDCPLTIAVQSGKLRDFTELQPIYRKMFDQGLLRIACHGMYHEDFSGVSMFEGFRTISVEEADHVLSECQEFARSFFGRNYSLFITPFFRMPSDPRPLYRLLVSHGFRAISVWDLVDPLGGVFQRYDGLYEVPYTMRFDFYRRTKDDYNGAVAEITFTLDKDPARYLRVIEDHIRMRFENDQYVCLYTHEGGFAEAPDGSYPGGKPTIAFLGKIVDWVKTRYPEADFVGMEDLLPQ